MLKGLVAGSVNLGIALMLGARLPAIGTLAGAAVLGFFAYGISLTLFVVASGVALLSELGGTNVGFPFGPYHYTEMLGYRIANDVPYPIPISWYYMLYCCLAFCGRILEQHAHLHTHDALEHEHEHEHDVHHAHHEPGEAPPSRHTHRHRHEPTEHSHAHFPDEHHRHSH